MRSFRTELEDPIVERDIIELDEKIRQYHEGKVDEDRFRSLRLARGVYGQRQEGVQMIRIKIPFGRISPTQLIRVANVSDEYSNGNLHVTTRQDIQIHHVSLDRTPELWAELERDDITLREACGNTVRNVTASAFSGIDTEEVFDVSPYAQATFEFFLRNPICQDMGRKIKIAFSSSEKDTAYTYIHDLGFIPKLKGSLQGFKVVVGGGLGAQPIAAVEVYDFLPAHKLIRFIEGVLRVFDRYGERARRNKARLKFLIKEIGIEQFLQLVNEQAQALSVEDYHVETHGFESTPPPYRQIRPQSIEDLHRYDNWLKTNVFAQKQRGYYAIGIKLQNGDISSDTARALAPVIERFASKDIRLTIGQNILLRFVRLEFIEPLYKALYNLGLADSGFDSIADVTACPGTDTCNLGISNSTRVAQVLGGILSEEYAHLVHDSEIKVKISGCMNSCGQHALAHIGFHGSSVKVDGHVAPAMQVLLGGGVVGDGRGRLSEKVIKVPSKRAPETLRAILNDYLANRLASEFFNSYYDRQGKNYFYELLKPLAVLDASDPELFQDWGYDTAFKTQIGVGECAGVVVDLVSTLILEAEEKLDNAQRLGSEGRFADSAYESYNSLIYGAKALLIDKGVKTNSQAKIVTDFESHYSDVFPGFEELVYRINREAAGEAFAKNYIAATKDFIERIKTHRNQ